MERIGVDGLQIACERAGTGPPLVLLVPGVGHAVNIEAPEAFNEAVRGFLSDLPEGA
jgi:hypothetical protein